MCALSRSFVSNSLDPMDCLAHQAPLSMAFSRQDYWSGLPLPAAGIFATHGLSPHLSRLLQCTWALCLFVTLCLGVGLFRLILFETLCASCVWISVSFFRFEKFSAVIYSHTFSIPLSPPSGIPILCRWAHFMLSHIASFSCSLDFHFVFFVFLLIG